MNMSTMRCSMNCKILIMVAAQCPMVKSPLKDLHNAAYFNHCSHSNCFKCVSISAPQNGSVKSMNESEQLISLSAYSDQLITSFGKWKTHLVDNIKVKEVKKNVMPLPSDIFTHTSCYNLVAMGLRKVGISGWFSVDFALGFFLPRCIFDQYLYFYVALFFVVLPRIFLLGRCVL